MIMPIRQPPKVTTSDFLGGKETRKSLDPELSSLGPADNPHSAIAKRKNRARSTEDPITVFARSYRMSPDYQTALRFHSPRPPKKG